MTRDKYTGKFLLAMPGMGDARFEKSVIYICSHTDDGAMGLMINHPASTLDFPTLLEELKIPCPTDITDVPIHLGGPVEQGRGFVLHSADYAQESTMVVSETVALTATVDILKALATGSGPKNHLLLLGYTGWGAGQLEKEMQENAWHMADADDEIIFHAPDESKWTLAMAQLGVDVSMLSSEAGHA